jgi:glycosyltransferase involved in cell wall biosynthesis
MKISRVTVLIATYNQANYISETIESVLENVRELKRGPARSVTVELIVVDDGSTDGTEEIVKQYEEFSDPHFELKYIYQQNQGQSAAYENVLDDITGEVVFLLDSDDRFVSTKIGKVINVFEEHPDVGLVGHPLHVIDSQGNRTGEIRPKAARISHGDIRDVVKKYGRNVAPATSGLAFRADLFKKIHPNPLRGISCGADGYLTMAISLEAPVYNLQEPLAEYRQHIGGQYIKRMTSVEGLKKTLEIQRRIMDHLELSETLENNSFFMRNILAYKKMTGSASEWLKSLLKLNKAIYRDPFLPFGKKLAFMLYWSFISILPRKMFWNLWLIFQRIQTGFKKLEVKS